MGKRPAGNRLHSLLGSKGYRGVTGKGSRGESCWTPGGWLGRGKGPGEKGKLSSHRVLLIGPHGGQKGSSTLKSGVPERRAGSVHPTLPASTRSRPQKKFRAALGVWDARNEFPEMGSRV